MEYRFTYRATVSVGSLLRIFRLRKDERWIALVALVTFIALNALTISAHWDAYTEGASGGFWTVFNRHFCVSGYDCWSWLTVSEGKVIFQTARHPLYLSLLYPLYWLNGPLMDWLDINFAVFLMGAVLVFSAVYSAIFMYRITHDVIGCRRFDALLLTALLCSFAHVMLAAMVPDHFIISMLLLLITLYMAGNAIQQGRNLKAKHLFLLAFLTCGMAVSNVAKTFLAALFVNGRRFFRLQYIAVGVLLPLLLLFGIQRYQYYSIEEPLRIKNETVMKNNPPKNRKAHDARLQRRAKWRAANDMKPAGEGLFKLMDFQTPRLRTLVHNVFGESLQLHRDHLLRDTLIDRPEFVGYRHGFAYAVEALIVLLFIAGIAAGLRQRFFLLALSWFGCDVMLHIVLGFGINEVFIMTSGWAFIIPIAIGFLLRKTPPRLLPVARTLLFLLTGYLWIYNLSLIVSYFTA